jgi:D-threo-aldose 1-dehydrogenase
MVNSIFLLFRFCGKNARRLVTERRLHLGNPRYNYGKTSWNISRQYMEKRASVLCGAGRRRGVDRRRTYRGASPCQCELYAGTIPPEFWAELKRQNLIEQNAPTPTAA